MRGIGEPGKNPSAEAVFGEMKYSAVVAQVRGLITKRDNITAAASPDLREALNRRLDQFAHVVRVNDDMERDAWDEHYRDMVGGETMRVRRSTAGAKPTASALVARPLYQVPDDDVRKKHYQPELNDAQDRPFDNLRGSDSSYGALTKYIKDSGGNPTLLQSWMGSQAGDSWNDLPQAYKYHLAINSKGLTPAQAEKEFYWRRGVPAAKKYYEQAIKDYGGAQVFEKTFAAYHAFTLDTLYTVSMPYVDRERGTVTVWRTDCPETVDGHQVGDTITDGKRGAAESCSLLNPVYVHNDKLLRQEVPFTDVLGTYLTERDPGRNHGAFLGDGEEEFVVMLGRGAYTWVAEGHPAY